MQWIDWSLKLYPIIVKMSQIIYDIIILFLKNSCKTKLTKQIMQLIWCLNEGNRRDTGCDIPASIVNLFMKMVFLYFSFKCWSILVLKWPKPKVCGKKSIAACSFCHFILNRRKCHVLVRVCWYIFGSCHQSQQASGTTSTQHSALRSFQIFNANTIQGSDLFNQRHNLPNSIEKRWLETRNKIEEIKL